MRKFISVLLAVMLVLSLTTVAFTAYNVVDADAPTLQEALEDEGYDGAMARVYFQMPTGKSGPIADEDVYVHVPEKLDEETGEVIEEAHDDLVIEEGGKAPSWYNEYNLAEDGKHYAGYYTWGAPASPAGWPGFRTEIDSYENSIFYVDIPGDDETVVAIFNNGVDGGTDSSLPIYRMAAQTVDTNMEGAMDGDYDTLWGDTYNDFDFDGCIYVIDPNQVSINAYSGQQTCGGNWYFYYGDGCYGHYRTDAEEFTSVDDCCVNPDHFKDGVHVGYQPDEEEPTEAPAEPTEAPAEPTDAPAEPTEAPAEPTEAPAEPTEAPAEPTEAPEDTITVYFTNNNNWSEVNAYYWPNGGDWPGTAAEFDHENGFGQKVYKAVLPATVTGLIFNGDGEQTADITENAGFQLVDGAEFYTTGEKDGNNYVVEQVGVEPVDQPTEEPIVWEQGYYLTGTIADWGLKEGMMLTDEGDGLYSYGPIALTTEDMIKVIDVNKKGTGIKDWYPDGWDNNRTVPADGEYMVYFRPAGDGTAEDGWEYIPYEGDDSGEDAHGCKRGGYMFKFVGNWVEPTDAPAEPTEAPEPTDAPVEPTDAPEPTDEPGPAPEPAAYIVGTFTNWAIDEAYRMAPNDSIEEYEFCLNVDLTTDSQFKCVIVMEGEQFWFPEGMGNNYGENGEITADGNYNVYFRPNYDGGDDWFYNCIYVESTGVEPTDAPAEPTDAPAEPTDAPEPTLAPQVGQFYVVGNFTSWAVDEAYVMTLNDAAETEEYIYNTNLTTESQFKVVYVDPETGEQTWLPDGMGNNYGENGEITEDGNYDIYFRPNGDGDDDWFYSMIYVVKNGEPTPEPTDEPAPVVWEQGYYLTGTIADWGLKEGMMLTDEGDGLYSYGPIALTQNDMIKVIDVNKKGTGIKDWYPDGWDNNRTVPADGEYMVYFRPAGDGTAEDGWEYIPYEGDGTGEDAHGCKRGGYMFKFVGETPEPTDAPAEPTDAPAEPTDAPAEPTDAPEPTDEPIIGETTYYVVGSMTDWQINEAYALTKNEASEVEEYSFSGLTLDTDSQFKIVGYNASIQGGNQIWYPDGMGNNYGENGEITEDGVYNVYLRPNYDGGDDWFYNCIYVEKTDAPTPTDAPPVWEQGYYLTGTIADWGLKEGMMLTDEGDGLYSYGPIFLTADDMIKVIDVNKKGTGIKDWYPDGWDNNRTVPGNGEYMVYFRPNGDGTAEDGWEYIPYEGDGTGEDAHGCKRGGYMFKFVSTSQPDYILGDVDGDGEVTSADATWIQRFDAHMAVTDNFNYAAADVDGDGQITIIDATCIQRYLAKIGNYTKWGIGEPGYYEA